LSKSSGCDKYSKPAVILRQRSKNSDDKRSAACNIDGKKKNGEQIQFFDGFQIKFQKKSHSNNDRRHLFSQKNFFFFFFETFFW
jgi:hypothetical protein